MTPRQVMIIATHCRENNEYEYESINPYDFMSFNALWSRHLLHYINNRIWVNGIRVKLTQQGINLHIKFHTPIKGRLKE
ncbi:hypothetical protein LCGC14_2720950 [marine sediment metagenome]|uniref:Uncharacterized protein n=1 Tax=marine sediment metagenome TaxID=412755 RepID=A0A0F8ZXR8_9ZZZZ